MKRSSASKYFYASVVAVATIVLLFSLVKIGSVVKRTVLQRSAPMVTSGQGVAFGAPADMKRVATDEAQVTIAPEPPRAGGGSTAVDLEGNHIEPRVIKTGELRLRVEDASDSIGAVTSLVTSKQGFVQSSSISDSGEGPRTAHMTIRIPVNTFEATMQELKDLSVLVLYEGTRGQDVTTEFVDLEANLRNARAEEESYRAILERSGSIEEILDVTRALAEVRGRIERLEGRKRYLENQTDLATIQLTLTEETRIELPTKKWKPLEVLRKSVRDLVTGLQGFVDFLIRFVISVLGLLIPVAAFVAFLIWLGWKAVTWFTKKLKK